MKKKIPYFFGLISGLSFAQASINNYFSVPNSQFAIVSQTVNQSASGDNAVWAFGTLTQTGTSTDTYAAPTANELTSYPTTTQVLSISDGSATNQAFYKNIGSTLSLTGASNPDFTLNYNTDNALIGTFPLAYGNTAVNDAIGGTISAQGQNPTYTGTINTVVDAFGVLSFTITGQGSYSGSVTRIKTIQNLAFTVLGIFPGTASITSYNYYKDLDGSLVFRTVEGVINAGLFNQTLGTTEALITNTLTASNSSILEVDIQMFPNPVQDTLFLNLATTNLQILETQVIDLNGRVLLTLKGNQRSINLSTLQSGLYLVKVNTSQGMLTRKIIKK